MRADDAGKISGRNRGSRSWSAGRSACAVKQVDAHAGQQSRPRLGMPRASIQAGSIRTMSISLSVWGFSRKPATRPVSSSRMMPMALAASRSTGMPAIVTSALCLAVGGHHLGEVHAIELVARQNQHVVDARTVPGGGGFAAPRRRFLDTSRNCSSVCWAARISTNPSPN